MTAVPAPSTDIPLVFHGGRVALRPVGAQDLPAFYQWRTELESLQLIRVPEGASSYQEVTPRLQSMLNRTITLLAVDTQRREARGFVQAYGVNAVDRWCYMLVYLAPQHRAERIGLEASVGFWDFLFSYLNLRKIYLDVSEANSGWLHAIPAQGILLKEEGRFREHSLHDGRYWDVTRYAIYREQWMELRDFLLLLLRLEANPGEMKAEGAGAERWARVASAAPGLRDRASPGRSWFGKRGADAHISRRMELVRRYVASERARQLEEVLALVADGIVYASPMTGTVTGKQTAAALLAFRQRMRDAAERAGLAQRVITWSPPEEDDGAVRIRGRKDPDEEMELVWEFDAQNKITAFSTFGSPGLLARWVLGDEPPLD